LRDGKRRVTKALWNPTNRLVVVAKPLTTEHTP
jgi:hypothetical protein